MERLKLPDLESWGEYIKIRYLYLSLKHTQSVKTKEKKQNAAVMATTTAGAHNSVSERKMD